MTQIAIPPPLILVVEDEPFIGYEIESTLTEAGYRVLGPMRSLKEARAALLAPDIALAVVDMLLIDGASNPIIEDLLSSNVPVIVTSGLNEQPALTQRCAGWFVKPYEPARLLELINTFVASTPSDDGQTGFA